MIKDCCSEFRSYPHVITCVIMIEHLFHSRPPTSISPVSVFLMQSLSHLKLFIKLTNLLQAISGQSWSSDSFLSWKNGNKLLPLEGYWRRLYSFWGQDKTGTNSFTCHMLLSKLHSGLIAESQLYPFLLTDILHVSFALNDIPINSTKCSVQKSIQYPIAVKTKKAIKRAIDKRSIYRYNQ